MFLFTGTNKIEAVDANTTQLKMIRFGGRSMVRIMCDEFLRATAVPAGTAESAY